MSRHGFQRQKVGENGTISISGSNTPYIAVLPWYLTPNRGCWRRMTFAAVCSVRKDLLGVERYGTLFLRGATSDCCEMSGTGEQTDTLFYFILYEILGCTTCSRYDTIREEGFI